MLLICVLMVWQDGGTALSAACQYGHSKVVDTLLKNGANVHDQLHVSIPNTYLISLCLSFSHTPAEPHSVQCCIPQHSKIPLEDPLRLPLSQT